MQWQALCDTRDDWRLANAEVYHLVWVELIAVNVAEVDVSGESHAVAGRQKLVCQLGCSVRQPIVADSLHEVTRAEAEAEGRDGGWPAVNHGIERELDFGRVMRVGAEQRYRVLCRTSGRHPALPVQGADRKVRMLYVERDCWVSRRYTTRDATQFRDAWASHTQAQRHGVLAMMIRPYKPRDSARSALLTAVSQYVTDDPGLAVHPRRVLHGPAAPDWQGEIRVGRTSLNLISYLISYP